MKALLILPTPLCVAIFFQDVNFPVIVQNATSLSAKFPDAPIYPSIRGYRMKGPVEGPVVS